MIDEHKFTATHQCDAESGFYELLIQACAIMR